jgi:hypothetical protein
MSNVVSMNPDAFEQSGFDLPEGDYEVKKARFGQLQYANGALGLVAQLTLLPHPNGKTEINFPWTCGDLNAFSASEDGKTLVRIGTRAQVSQSTRWYTFLEALVKKCGFPASKLDDGDISVLEGLIAHFANIADQPRQGLNLAPEGADRKKLVAVVTNIIKMPWDKLAPKVGQVAKQKGVNGHTTPLPAPVAAAAAAAPGPSLVPPPPPAVVTEEDQALFTEHVAVAIGETPLPAARSKVRVAMFKSMNDAKVESTQRDRVLKLLNDNNYVSNLIVGVGDGYALSGNDIVSL